MTEYEVSVENRVFTIKFTTNNQGSADKVRDICKKLAEDDKPVPKVKPCPFCGGAHIGRSVTLQYVGPIGPLTRRQEWEGIIGCSECGVYLRGYFDKDDFSKVSAEAALVEKWNKRKQI